MGFPIERYCSRNGSRWLLICSSLAITAGMAISEARWLLGKQALSAPAADWAAAEKHFVCGRNVFCSFQSSCWQDEWKVSVIHGRSEHDCFCSGLRAGLCPGASTDIYKSKHGDRMHKKGREGFVGMRSFFRLKKFLHFFIYQQDVTLQALMNADITKQHLRCWSFFSIKTKQSNKLLLEPGNNHTPANISNPLKSVNLWQMETRPLFYFICIY